MSNFRKNWKLNLLALSLIFLFIHLGVWQLHRAHEKQNILTTYKQRMHMPALTAKKIATQPDLRFFRLQLIGYFDNQHTVLLDNKTLHGQIGYEIYTPFISPDLPAPILVDRGFLPLRGDRQDLPKLPPMKGNYQVTGLLNLPPRYFALGKIYDGKRILWPLRIQYLNLPELSEYTGRLFEPYILLIDHNHPAALESEWQIVMMGPEKHLGYALQWFAFALTLLIISIALNRRARG